MQMACIAQRDLDDPHSRVSLARYVALMDAAVDLCGDPGLPLDFGEQVPMDQLSIVPLIASHAATPEDGAARINRYSALMLDDGDDSGKPALEMTHRHGKLWIRFGSPVYARYPAIAESGIARSVARARRMLSSAGSRATSMRFPEAIHFEYPEPPHRAEYDRVFGVPLVFGSDMTAIAIDPAMLSVSMPKQFGAAATIVTERADVLLADLRKTSSTRESVEAAIARSFASGDVRMETVARQLGLSRATLFRKLKAEGATYDEVLQTLRRDRAQKLLNEEKRSVHQVAHMLGFSDPAAFSRAFKRWTGVSPSEVQRR
jgi:AraC-like DNA-binding protein